MRKIKDLVTDLFTFKKKINTYDELNSLIEQVYGLNVRVTLDKIIKAFEAYDEDVITRLNLTYFLVFLFRLGAAVFDDEDCFALLKDINNLIEDEEGNINVLSEKGIDYYYEKFDDLKNDFKDRDLSLDELWSYVSRYTESRLDELDENTKENIKYALDILVKNNHVEGTFFYGRLLYGDVEGIGIKQDYKKALKCYLFAGENGISQGYVNAGYIYYFDRLKTGERNYKEAYNCFLKAKLIDNNPNAVYKLFDMYYNGYYVEKDINMASTLIAPLAKEFKDMSYGYLLKNDVQLYVPIISRCLSLFKGEEEIPIALIISLFKAYYLQLRNVKIHDYNVDKDVLRALKERIERRVSIDEMEIYFTSYCKEKFKKDTFYYLDDIQNNFNLIVKYKETRQIVNDFGVNEIKYIFNVYWASRYEKEIDENKGEFALSLLNYCDFDIKELKDKEFVYDPEYNHILSIPDAFAFNKLVEDSLIEEVIFNPIDQRDEDKNEVVLKLISKDEKMYEVIYSGVFDFKYEQSNGENRFLSLISKDFKFICGGMNRNNWNLRIFAHNLKFKEIKIKSDC